MCVCVSSSCARLRTNGGGVVARGKTVSAPHWTPLPSPLAKLSLSYASAHHIEVSGLANLNVVSIVVLAVYMVVAKVVPFDLGSLAVKLWPAIMSLADESPLSMLSG